MKQSYTPELVIIRKNFKAAVAVALDWTTSA